MTEVVESPPRVVRGATITDAMHKAIRSHLWEPSPDAVLNIETHLFHNTIEAASCEYDLDLGLHVWLNEARWSRLIREYVPREPLERFIEQSREILQGNARDGATANMLFNDPPRSAKKHRWGGCLMGATFKGEEHPTLTFFSRTTYIGYMGLLDAAIAHVMVRHITGDPSRIAFRWHITSQQLHAFKTIPFMLTQNALRVKLRYYSTNGKRSVPTPTWEKLTYWYAKVLQDFDRDGVQMIETEKYNQFRRVKRRWLEHHGHLDTRPPSLHVEDLDFSKAA